MIDVESVEAIIKQLQESAEVCIALTSYCYPFIARVPKIPCSQELAGVACCAIDLHVFRQSV